MALDTLRDSAGERRLVTRRLLFALLFCVLGIGLLSARMVDLQILGFQHYTTLAEQNRIRLQPVPPTRGLIFDRNGTLLADNITTYRLVVTPERSDDLERTVQRLGQLLELRQTDLERFWRLAQRQRRFQEIPIKYELTDAEVARLAVNRHRFPSVEIKRRLVRHYPQGATAAHALGYVGRISEPQLERRQDGAYQGDSYIGKTGIEKYYESRLRGDIGAKQVETNANGRVLRTLERQAPTPGQDLTLTLDIDLQRTAQAALGDESGAVVAMNPRNGAVLAFVSKPSFDPNLFVNGISLAKYRELQSGRSNALFNRASRGHYPPGSTFKPFVGLAGLEARVRSPDKTIYCNGRYSPPNVRRQWRDWKRWGHGEVDMKQAIAQSCDVYFYGLAYNMGINTMHDLIAPFGFGQATGIDLPNERTGILPSKQWKRRTKGKPWYHGETVNAGIGQGFVLTTPLQLADVTTTLANRGEPVRPHLLRGIRRPGDTEIELIEPKEPNTDAIELDDPHQWDTVIEGMHAVVHGRHGTARAIAPDGDYDIAGKTGTAQVFGLAQDEEYNEEEIKKSLRDHALFIAFAPVDEPRIVVSVVVENGGSGSHSAAPVARKVLDAWLAGGNNDSAHG